jgi:hypothetical protein
MVLASAGIYVVPTKIWDYSLGALYDRATALRSIFLLFIFCRSGASHCAQVEFTTVSGRSHLVGLSVRSLVLGHPRL